MRSFIRLALPFAAAVAGSVQAQQPATVDGATAAANDTSAHSGIPHTFIIEYAAGFTKRDLDVVHNNPNISVVDNYDNAIFTGASIKTDVYNIDSLQALPGVARAWVNKRVKLAVTTNATTAIFPAPQILNYTTHNVTGVSAVHAKGFLGQGVKVGVVDTGTWYLHPALGGGFGPGYKVAGGWDFVGNGDWPASGEKEPDADPIDQQGHGTHVAGILAGQLDGFVGVAPEATIYSYKVFGTVDDTDEATLIDAFLRAYSDGVDIITASIGLPDNWAEDAWSVVASRIVDEGVVVTISAGNDGATGPLQIGIGSSGVNVLAVASTSSEVLPTFGFSVTIIDSQNRTVDTVTLGYLPSTDAFPASVVDWPIVPLNLDSSVPDDGCQPWPAGTMNLTGKIPLVRRGTCTFAVKQGYLEALGAEYILFYNNETPLITPGTIDPISLIGLIPADQGQSIIDVYKSGGRITGSFAMLPSPEPVGVVNTVANLPDTYTSWGPLYDLTPKPDIAAPGGNIYSTYLDDSWAILSGTSMACPFVAGVAALYLSKYGSYTEHGAGYAKELVNKIVSSGNAVPWSDGTNTSYGYSASVAQVGGGLVDANKLINYATSLTFDKIALNDTQHFSGSHSLTVTNNGEEALTYTLSSEAAAGFNIFAFTSSYQGDTRTLQSFDELEPYTLEPSVALPDDFVLQPGETKTVTVNFENPENLGWNSTLLPVYSGKIIVTSSSGEVLSAPYLGLGADLKKEMDPIDATGYPWGTSSTLGTSLKTKNYFSFDLSLAKQDFPIIYSYLLWGSRQVRWDIYEAGWTEQNWTYPPVEGENGYLGAATYWYNQENVNYFDPSQNDANDTLTYPVTDVQGGGWNFWWFGKLGNGSQIANGTYTWRFATLLPFGDPTKSSDWEVYQVYNFSVTGQY